KRLERLMLMVGVQKREEVSQFNKTWQRFLTTQGNYADEEIFASIEEADFQFNRTWQSLLSLLCIGSCFLYTSQVLGADNKMIASGTQGKNACESKGAREFIAIGIEEVARAQEREEEVSQFKGTWQRLLIDCSNNEQRNADDWEFGTEEYRLVFFLHVNLCIHTENNAKKNNKLVYAKCFMEFRRRSCSIFFNHHAQHNPGLPYFTASAYETHSA
ncbi:hypothetical protein ACJX0J_039277, partial [Zea mays]